MNAKITQVQICHILKFEVSHNVYLYKVSNFYPLMRYHYTNLHNQYLLNLKAK